MTFCTLVRTGWIALFCLVAIQIVRFTMRRSPVLGRVVLAGSMLHLLSALVLFAISWFNLPILQSLHSGDGFWHLAPDARIYFTTATTAVYRGLHTIEPGSPSPVYVAALAIWMKLIGVHPLSPLLFNAFAYVLLNGGIIWRATSGAYPARTSAVMWPIVALSFSPMLLLSGTQVLKDVTFAALMALVALSVRELFLRLDVRVVRDSRPALAGALAGLAGLWLGVYGVAGIRAYYAAFVALALVIPLVLYLRQALPLARRYAVLGLTALGLVWSAFALGAGPYYLYYHNVAIGTFNAATGGLLASLVIHGQASFTAEPKAGAGSLAIVDAGQAVDALRQGFATSGGATNIIRADDEDEDDDAAANEGEAAKEDGDEEAEGDGRSRWERAREKASAVGVGLAAIFVPISVLQALDVVRISGGRGFLSVTDLDTIFIDLTLIGVTWLLIRERRAVWPHRMYLWFCVLMFLLSTLLMAYVVTNLGTLFRLRLMALVPLWLAPLAVTRLAPPSPRTNGTRR